MGRSGLVGGSNLFGECRIDMMEGEMNNYLRHGEKF